MEKRIRQITHITGGKEEYSNSLVMQFIDGTSLPLKFVPYFWTKHWKDVQIKPEEHCKVTEDTQDSKYFSKLTCKIPNSEQPEYSREIPSIFYVSRLVKALFGF